MWVPSLRYSKGYDSVHFRGNNVCVDWRWGDIEVPLDVSTQAATWNGLTTLPVIPGCPRGRSKRGLLCGSLGVVMAFLDSLCQVRLYACM